MPVFSMTKVESQKEAPKTTLWDQLYHWRYVLSGIMFTLIVLLGGWFFVYPRWSNLSDIEAQTQQQNNTNAQLQQLLSRLETLEKNYADARQSPNIALLESVIPDSIDVARILVDMDGVAKKAGLPVTAVDVQLVDANATKPANTIAKGIIPYQFKLKLQGPLNYDSYKKFLTTLENTLPLYDVQTGTVQAPLSSSGSSAGASMDLQVQSYYLLVKK